MLSYPAVYLLPSKKCFFYQHYGIEGEGNFKNPGVTGVRSYVTDSVLQGSRPLARMTLAAVCRLIDIVAH
jgi:hypothetical protein